jgi:hypothetical protein
VRAGPRAESQNRELEPAIFPGRPISNAMRAFATTLTADPCAHPSFNLNSCTNGKFVLGRENCLVPGNKQSVATPFTPSHEGNVTFVNLATSKLNPPPGPTQGCVPDVPGKVTVAIYSDPLCQGRPDQLLADTILDNRYFSMHKPGSKRFSLLLALSLPRGH